METKKISFGFSKINKKPNLLPSKVAKEENKIELIKCVEGQAIKLVVEKPEETPLVIPLKQQHKTSAALASLMRRRAVLLGEEEEEQQPETTEAVVSAPATNGAEPALPETLEARAARELLAELNAANGEAAESTNLVLPVVHPDELPLDGAKESTLDDYDSVPIQQYGLAMLRGMGWEEPPPTKKKKGGGGGELADEAPFVRPKGMGLGADKALKAKPLLVAPEANEVLEIKKQAFVRILGGKHKDLYGQIEGFDDYGARVIVKMAIGGAKEAFNEFLCQAVSRKEFAQYGKCINSAKYEEFKKLENEHGQIIVQHVKEEKPRIKRESLERLHEDKRNEKRELKAEEEKLNDSKRRVDNYERNPKSESSRKYDEQPEKSHIKKEFTERRQNDNRSENREAKMEEKYKDSKSREVNYENERKPRNDDTARKDESERKKSSTSSTRRYEEEDQQRQSARGSNRVVEEAEERREKRKSRSTERRRDHHETTAASRSSRQHHNSTESSADSESDSNDSEYKRKLKKKSSHKSKSRKHEKKSKSKSKRKSDCSDSDDDRPSRSNKSHKKKTKKSKKQRSRSPRGRR